MKQTDLPKELADAIAEAHGWRRKSKLSFRAALIVSPLIPLAPIGPYFLLTLPLALFLFAYFLYVDAQKLSAIDAAHELALKCGEYGLVDFIFNGEFEQ